MKKINYLAGAVWAASLFAQQALGSGHREAPLIAEDPPADSTDLYVFRSPQSDPDAVTNSLTIIATYWPLQEPGGGPNWPRFSDGVLYEIKIDNDGDAQEDIVYQFRFRTEYRRPRSFLLAGGPVASNIDSNLHVVQRYTVTRIDKNGRRELLQDQPTPPAHAGDFTMPAYGTLATGAVYELGGNVNVHGRVFAGQRDDPFFADLGAIFDLMRVRCQAQPNDAMGCGGNALPKKGVDFIAGYNVHSIALQIPIHQLTADGSNAPTGKHAILGVWTTASRPRVTVRRAPALEAALSGIRTQDSYGPWVQVSRLGLPLLNQMLVPVGLKDFFNASPPSSDAALFTSQAGAPLLTDPELARVFRLLYNLNVPAAGRTDLLELLQFHITTSEGGNPVGPFRGKMYSLVPADILRIDVSLPPPTDLSSNRMAAAGVLLGGVNDPNLGFPNGRRLQDDVVDIIMSLVSGVLRGRGTLLGDGVDGNDRPFLGRFPYLAPPWSGSSVGIAGSHNPRLHQSSQGGPQ